MSTPPRLSTSGSDFETKLLRAAKAETPKRDRMLRAAAAASTLALGTGVATKSVVAPKIPAWLAAVFGGVGIVGGAALVAPTTPAPLARLEERAPIGTAVPIVSSAPIADLPSARAESEPPKADRGREKPAAKTTAAALPRARIADATPPVPRAEELSMLRQAKIDIARGDGHAALAVLDAHGQTFPKTAFAEEVAALRVEAFAAAGDETRARRAAADFDARYPESPYALRVRSAVARARR